MKANIIIRKRTCGYIAALVLFAVILLNGCYNDVVVPDTVPPVAGEVSFSQDVQPIFDTSCNSAGCHSNGGVAPNLSNGAAYGVLINAGYVDTQNPSSSTLYQWMSGNGGVDMPPSGSIASANATVLAWIEQGALNN